MSPDEMIAVITAHKEGKAIQYRYRRTTDWIDCSEPIWQFGHCDYRVKPELKPDKQIYVFTSARDNELHDLYEVALPTANLRLTFDGETSQLKSAEVLK